jgi:CHAD domain-containing protein
LIQPEGLESFFYFKKHSYSNDLIQDKGLINFRWRKVHKKGKALAQLDATSRHKLRIQAKKLRYAAEFFASLFSTKRALKRRYAAPETKSAAERESMR